MPSTITPHCGGKKTREVAGESSKWAAEEEQGEEKGGKREKTWGVPRLGQEFRIGVLLSKSKLSYLLQSLLSISLCLSLIGFNERFNNIALPDQINLLLSTALNPGSLLLNAGVS